MPDVTTPADGEELRAKYNQKERDEMAKSGAAMADGSYPIEDSEDLKNAISTVGLGNASNASIRAHIIKRAKALGLTSLLPDSWDTKTAETDTEDRAQPTAQDANVTKALSTAQEALAAAHEAQKADPDTDDPDDEKVEKAIEAAGGALAEAVAAQAQDAAPEARKRLRKPRHRAIPLDREVRHFVASGLEVRAEGVGEEIKITGQPIRYDTPYTVRDAFGEFTETMRPGCAKNVLDRGVDCRFLLNHEGLPMARTSAGTLRLWDTKDALNFEATLDARQHLASDFAIAVERGDITQMSVGMIVGRDEWGVAGGRETRDVQMLDDLLDVSGVTYPASPTTSIEIAKRMALEVPVESQARMRRLEVELRSGNVTTEELAEALAVLQGHDERAGAVLSGASKSKVATAISALHDLYEASGGNPGDLVKSPPEPEAETEDGTSLGDVDPDPGESIRARTSAAELRLRVEAIKRRRPATSL